ncbi:MAG: Ig domain-containing protein [Lachnospiraceae bacterium]|nr:Ig domain-containing protein [Lachnospiraceae bacterium]
MKKKSKTGRKLFVFLLALTMVVGLMSKMSLTVHAYTAIPTDGSDAGSGDVFFVGYTIGTQGGNYQLGDDGSNMFDKNEGTKACIGFSGSYSVEFSYVSEIIPHNYYFRTGGDTANFTKRNPSAWKLEGKNSDGTWTELDNKSGQTYTTESDTEVKFAISNTNAYKTFRLTITDINQSGSEAWPVGGLPTFQLSEVYMSGVNSGIVDVTSVTLNQDTVTLIVDDTEELTATVSPNDASDKSVIWSTNSDNVKLYSDAACTTEVGSAATDTLTVYAKGVTAGDDTVTVTSNADATLTASCDVTVSKLAGTISYATTSVSKKKGDSAFTNELSKTGDGTVTYSSDKESVATVDGTGKVMIVGAGEANITATVADSASYTYATKKATYKLTVSDTAVSTAEYSVTSDSTSEWTLDSGVDITVTVKRSTDDASCFSHYKGVQIDGKALTADDYTAKSGSTIVTLKASVLQKLTAGEHTVTVLFDDGKADMILTVKEKAAATDTTTNSTTTTSSDKAKSPTTGDRANVAVAFMLMLDSALAALYISLRKKLNKRMK